MAVDRERILDQSPPSPQRLTTVDLIDRLSRFDGPPEQFLVNLLAVQCHIASAEAGAILRAGQAGPELLAIFPPVAEGSAAPPWLAQAVESAAEVAAGGVTVIKAQREPDDMYGQPARRHVIIVPLKGGAGVRGITCFGVDTADPSVLAIIRERLELTTSLLSLYEMRLTLEHRQFDLRRLRMAMETLNAVNENDRFAGAAMTFCNEISARWAAERVSLGFLKGRYVHLKALSHTEKFNRKMKLVQDIEAAMEECLDQDVEVLYPALPEATYVSRAVTELSRRQGPTAVVSLPLRRKGKTVAVVTVERPVDKPFAMEEIEPLRLACELTSARLISLQENDRWVGARMAATLRKGAAAVVGPKHTWMKLLAVAILAFLFYAIVLNGDYTAEAKFSLEAVERQFVSAPFDGQVETVNVEPGDLVVGGKTVLAALRTDDLRKNLAKAEADRDGYLKQREAAMRDNKTADAQVALAQAQSAEAEAGLLRYQIGQANLISPLGGYVVTGDWKRQHDVTVKKGDPMFEVAPLESLRAELSVPEDAIADVVKADAKARGEGRELEGELATTAYPAEKIHFSVERINPVAEIANQQNVFKVRVRLANTYDWMRPGMEGVAKIDIGRRSHAWIWSRPLVNWVRMKLWW